MALNTYVKRIQDAEKEYNAKLDTIRGEMGTEFAKNIGNLIPNGWSLKWVQSDDQYNDEGYEWGMEGFRIVRGRKDIHFGYLGGDGPDSWIGGADVSEFPKLGLTMKGLTELFEALDSIDENTYRTTFGECAQVTIGRDGTCQIKRQASNRDTY